MFLAHGSFISMDPGSLVRVPLPPFGLEFGGCTPDLGCPASAVGDALLECHTHAQNPADPKSAGGL